MPLPTDYERDERRAREAAKIDREIDKADHDRDRKRDDPRTCVECGAESYYNYKTRQFIGCCSKCLPF